MSGIGDVKIQNVRLRNHRCALVSCVGRVHSLLLFWVFLFWPVRQIASRQSGGEQLGSFTETQNQKRGAICSTLFLLLEKPGALSA